MLCDTSASRGRKETPEQTGKKKKGKLWILIVVLAAAALCVAGFLFFRKSDPLAEDYKKAETLLSEGRYEEAIRAFTELGEYKDSTDRIREAKELTLENEYRSAEELLNAGQYESAIDAFTALGGYKDSADRINEIRERIREEAYQAAEELLNAGKYEDAITAFENLDGYRDSADRINEIRERIREDEYQAAVKVLDSGAYDEAVDAFTAMDGYGDSANMIKEAYYRKADDLRNDGLYMEAFRIYNTIQGYKDVNSIISGDRKIAAAKEKATKERDAAYRAGRIVTLGKFEQDGDESNGPEAIEWQVLERKGDKALIISKYCLDARAYNTEPGDVTWETCSLREWLNGDFLNSAFSEEERNGIITTAVEAEKNPDHDTEQGKDTLNQVFLLSSGEAGRYFRRDSDRVTEATPYAKEKGGYTHSDGNTWWWLRTSGDVNTCAVFVLGTGKINNFGEMVEVETETVRPAMWVNITKLPL